MEKCSMADLERVPWCVLCTWKIKHICTKTENEDKRTLEKFVITMYDRSSFAIDIDELRLDMFALKQKPYDAIPPTQGALI